MAAPLAGKILALRNALDEEKGLLAYEEGIPRETQRLVLYRRIFMRETETLIKLFSSKRSSQKEIKYHTQELHKYLRLFEISIDELCKMRG